MQQRSKRFHLIGSCRLPILRSTYIVIEMKTVLVFIWILFSFVQSEIVTEDISKLTTAYFGAKNIYSLNFVSCFSSSKFFIRFMILIRY